MAVFPWPVLVTDLIGSCVVFFFFFTDCWTADLFSLLQSIIDCITLQRKLIYSCSTHDHVFCSCINLLTYVSLSWHDFKEWLKIQTFYFQNSFEVICDYKSGSPVIRTRVFFQCLSSRSQVFEFETQSLTWVKSLDSVVNINCYIMSCISAFIFLWSTFNMYENTLLINWWIDELMVNDLKH